MLVDKLFISGSWVAVAAILQNVTGTPLVSAIANEDGEPISDLYTLTVSARSGGTCTITVTTGSFTNPYNGLVFTMQPCDDTTELNHLVPGATIVLDNAAANGNVATVQLGSPYGSFNSSGVDAGIPTTGVRHKVTNTGGSSSANCAIKHLVQAIMVDITNRPFTSIKSFAPSATEKTAGGGSDRVMPYALTISSVSGAGPTQIATVKVDGANTGSILLDVTTGATVSGIGLKALGDYPYKFLSGPLQDLEFVISDTVANGDKANVLIFNSRYIQTAEDISGSASTYGTADVSLTESGQASGVITPSGDAYFWTRFLVPSLSSNESNPYPCNLAITASESTGAGWGE